MNNHDISKRSSILRRLLIAGAVLLVAAVLGVIVFADRSQTRAYPFISTGALYRYDSQPPWPSGNHLTVVPGGTRTLHRIHSWSAEHFPALGNLLGDSGIYLMEGWAVLNMHSENFSAFCKQAGTEWLKVEKVGENGCLVVDSRVPPEWFLTYPGGTVAEGRALRLERPEYFNTPPVIQAMIGTGWELVDRKDPDGWLDRLLPGDRIEFQDMDLECFDREGQAVGQRVWKMDDSGDGLSVHALQGDTSTSIFGRIEREADTFTFTLTGTGKGTAWSIYPMDSRRRGQAVTTAKYRLVSTDI